MCSSFSGCGCKLKQLRLLFICIPELPEHGYYHTRRKKIPDFSLTKTQFSLTIRLIKTESSLVSLLDKNKTVMINNSYMHGQDILNFPDLQNKKKML